MKKKLEADLISIAHRVLKLTGKEDIAKLHAETGALYEKLSVLKFANENFEGDLPIIGIDSSFFGMLDTAFNNKVSDNIEHDGIYEPVMEKIKDMVAQMPQESQQVDDMFASAVAQKEMPKTHLEDITAGFEEIPVFEPISQANENLRKSLNDKLKNSGLNIGLNDKLAFIKHLFNGEVQNYERVLSQLNTTSTYQEASHLLNDIVKPDYNNWKGKEEFESRFFNIIERKFD
jgi:hypothetical protein